MDHTNSQNNIRHILRALQYRNYRLFFAGQSISLVGTWMQSLAMGWLVYRMTNSAFALGVIGFSSQIAAFFISPFAGVWADRWNRYRLVIATQTLAMLQAFILAALVLSGHIRVWHIVALSVVLGLVNSFDMPVRQSFTIDMIEQKKDLGNAIALNSLMFNSARFIGPPLAGVLVAHYGEGVCFLVNGFSYIAVIVALAFMKSLPKTASAKTDHVFASLKEGFVYTFGFPPMRFILILMGLVSVVVMPYAVLLPAFARDTLGGSSRTLGFLMGSAGLGAFAGGIVLAAKKDVRGLGRVITATAFIFGAGLVLLSLSRSFGEAAVLMAAIGFSIMVYMASSNTVLQTIVDDDKRGRVMGFYTMAFIGLTPFGSIGAGSLAQHIGTPRTIMIAGIVCVIAAFVISRKLSSFNRVIDAAKL